VKPKTVWIVIAAVLALFFIIAGLAGSHDSNKPASAQASARPDAAAAVPTALAGADTSPATIWPPAASDTATSDTATTPPASAHPQALTGRSPASHVGTTKAASVKKSSAPKAQPTHAASAAAAQAACHPLTNGGNCYEPGEFCRKTDHGATGVAGDGKSIVCQDNDGWRWEPA
jgi:hypothetical protein